MSTTVEHANAQDVKVAEGGSMEKKKEHKGSGGLRDSKGFIAGVASGITKCTVGHPFDTVKVRLQTTPDAHFRGPVDCVLQTVRREGVRGFYKGMTPPLIGWMGMDSLMLGSLTVYRRLLNENFFNRAAFAAADFGPIPPQDHPKLPAFGHGIAGMGAGATVSFLAAPIEHVKARLQVQYSAKKAGRLYSGPVDCAKKIFRDHGVRGLYRGLYATIFFRSFFFFWWGSYDLISQAFHQHTKLSTPAINFWAGGLSAQVFWLTSYPSDVVKQRIMTDGLGNERRFARWIDASRAVYAERGLMGYWRGFVPSALRAFPANAMALVAFEAVMRAIP